MGELKGSLFATIFFIGFIFPGLLMFGIDSLHNHAFVKHTTELTEIVKQEGGATQRVHTIAAKLNQKSERDKDGNPMGYTINFSQSGKAAYGQTINITYTYRYANLFGVRTLTTDKSVLNRQRP